LSYAAASFSANVPDGQSSPFRPSDRFLILQAIIVIGAGEESQNRYRSGETHWLSTDSPPSKLLNRNFSGNHSDCRGSDIRYFSFGAGMLDKGGNPRDSGCRGVILRGRRIGGGGGASCWLRRATTSAAATPTTKTTIRLPRITAPHSTPTQCRLWQSRQRKTWARRMGNRRRSPSFLRLRVTSSD
jgi:hypothetical protein